MYHVLPTIFTPEVVLNKCKLQQVQYLVVVGPRYGGLKSGKIIKNTDFFRLTT